MKPQHYTKNNQSKLGRHVVLSREERTDWLSSAEWSALKTYIQVTSKGVWTQQVMLRNLKGSGEGHMERKV